MLENHVSVLIAGFCGNPIGIVKALDDDAHVKTRIEQYEALKSGRGIHVAKQFVNGKIEGQNQVLKKYGLRSDTSIKLKVNALETDDLTVLRKQLLHIEGEFGEFYFNQILQLFPEKIRPEHRQGFKAYDGVNNLFNLAYEVLFWKCYSALVKAHLEPYLGFLHSVKFGFPSLVCDFQELYRFLIDDFVVEYAQSLKKKDFKKFNVIMCHGRHGLYPRLYLNNEQHDKFRKCLHAYFRHMVEIPRIMRGSRQEFETLINEEALLFAKYLRGEIDSWIPRVPSFPFLTVVGCELAP
jgi:CRISPR-associated protein Cas1